MGQRYLPTHNLPIRRYLPGVGEHPKSLWTGEVRLDPLCPETCLALRYSLDLYHHEFFWECHQGLEALWNGQKRKGEVADFLKSFIHLAAAQIKFKLGRADAGLRHLHRAKTLISEIQKTHPHILGFNLEKILKDLVHGLTHTQFRAIEIHPEWK